ncbi:MAG TPA: phosphotransferase [Anaerolineae bacterium]|jgi:Ser/Thr protein kinase RdoA (MazF antagonist)
MDINPVILEAGARLFAVNSNDLKRLGGMDGVAYAYTQPDTGREYVLKFTPFPGFAPLGGERIATIGAKLDFVNYLSLNGVSVAKPAASINGAFVETLQMPDAPLPTDGQEPHEPPVYAVTSSERAPGRHVFQANEWNGEMFEEWGRIIGQMHRLTRVYEAQRTWPDGLVGNWESELYSFGRSCKDNEVRSRWFALGDVLRSFTPTPDCYGLIHNDPHQFNFMVHRQDGVLKLTLFDFDVCAYHWFMTDIGIALYHALMARRMEGQSALDFASHFIDRFMRGYSRENTLDNKWLLRLPLFTSYRRMLLYMVFTHEWASPTVDQKRQLDMWRQDIINDAPVIAVD